MTPYLHIVCLDCPAPPDYGGAMDMFYKIKALHEIGKKIILHYFDYKPGRSPQALAPFCTAIFAYKRRPPLQALSLRQPYSVLSRVNSELVLRLNQDSYPVLLEGLHCSGILPLLNNPKRAVIRMHNNEAAYYHHLATSETAFVKRQYFLQESRLLHRYQQAIDKAIPLACLAATDMDVLQQKYDFRNMAFIPCFIPWQQVNSQPGRGEYCLYHGNLSIAENEQAVTWLLKNVFNEMPLPLVIAGSHPSKRLEKLTKDRPDTKLIRNPPADELAALIRDAQLHVLPSLNNTGVKLKLLHALLNGRFCLTNAPGVAGSGIQTGVQVQNTAAAWRNSVLSFMEKEFTPENMAQRQSILRLYNNFENARQLNALWRHYQ